MNAQMLDYVALVRRVELGAGLHAVEQARIEMLEAQEKDLGVHAHEWERGPHADAVMKKWSARA